ncbi:MAG: ABC transporter permease, partial [Alphaproteobacteria bacterium]|nr:ABC transporter permease [Alphaproteobacteria bacterium]
MLAYVLNRLLATIPVMAVVALVVFLILRLSPGDPATVIAGDYATPETVAKIRAGLGLDRPLHEQFASWLWQLMQGDLGISIFTDLPVAKLIGQRLEPTISLALTTITFAIVVAVPLGTIAAWKAGTWIDRIIMLFCVLGFSVPVFVLGYLLIYGVSMELGWLPVQGFKSIREGLWPFLRNIILPTLTLSVIYIAIIARITRATVIEVLEEDYIRTARAKGQVERKVLLVHAVRNAAVPIVTIIGIGVALLIGGVV